MKNLVILILLYFFPFMLTAQSVTELGIQDTRNINLAPSDFNWYSGRAFKMRIDFKERSVLGVPGWGTYSTLFTIPQWGDNSGGKMHQLNFNDGGVFLRQAYAASSNWEIWQKFVIEDGSGRVGIGTSLPEAKFHIKEENATIRLTGGSYTSSEIVDGGTGDPGYIRTFYYGNIDNQIGAYGTYFAALGGNVGIGTTNPTEKLSVNGNVRARKLIITQTAWSDYVFNKNYKLRSISEVEKFIIDNHHLPEVPTAKEVATKGISVGETQALLLKKIEELTLYVIELKKENLIQSKAIVKMDKIIQNLKK
jgi:hypothetical protein